MLLEGGLTYKQTGLSQKDMDFLEQRKWNRDEILAVYKVPKGELGVEDETGSYAKDKTRRKLFWETTLQLRPRWRALFKKETPSLSPESPS
jgi:phage portal protein BeeE